MAKYVVFSFDDGRQDTYTNAFAVLRQYAFAATLNVATDFVNNPHSYHCFASGDNRSMTWEQIDSCQSRGWEIASHGHKHLNEKADAQESLLQLEMHGLKTEGIGFASPNSFIHQHNCPTWMKESFSYVRSGIQIRREGLLYAGFSFLNRYLGSKKLYCLLNSRCKLKADRQITQNPLLSVGISSEVTAGQVISLLSTLKDSECYILMFHSILSERENGWKVDRWWWDIEKFAAVCQWLAEQKDFQVLTTKQFIDLSLQAKEDSIP